MTRPISLTFLLCLASTSLTVAGAEIAGGVASLQIPGHDTTGNLTVTVENQGLSEVRLANCEDSFSVAAGATAEVSLAGEKGFWLVPADAAWSCDGDDFSFYYVHSSPRRSSLSVGFGLDDRSLAERQEEREQLEYFESNQSTSDEGSSTQSVAPLRSIAGLKLVASSTLSSETAVVCNVDSCGEVRDIHDPSSTFRLIVLRNEGLSLRGSFAQRSHHSYSGGHSGWHQGGDKVWGHGSGVESINSRDVGYYNSGMQAARAHCGGAGCALLVNPPGHRTVNYFHIHFIHYKSYGANLKRKMEAMVCGKGGWHSGGLPCGGRAAFFPGFPAVFSVAGNVHDASVIAWPQSCGGRGTIVEVAYGCSIEHQIRGDFNPRYR